MSTNVKNVSICNKLKRHNSVADNTNTVNSINKSVVKSLKGPIVETLNGLCEGFTIKMSDGRKANVFIGIPYAIPPINGLRFKV